MKRLVSAAMFAVLMLAACNGGQAGQETPSPTATPIGSGTATTATPSPVVQAECPTPTVCPGPTACPSAPGCPEPVTCPTCAEPVTCPPAVTCPEETACPADDIHSPARANLEACKVQLDISDDLWVTCDQELRDCQAALPGQQVNCFELMQYASLLELQISMCLDRPCTYEHEQLAIIETALNAYCR